MGRVGIMTTRLSLTVKAGMNNDYEWTSATDDVFKDCVIPATTFDKGPLQFEIDEQLNTTWYKE